MLIKLHNTNIEIPSDLNNWQLSSNSVYSDNVETLKLTLKSEEKTTLPKLRLKWKRPKIDMQYIWHESSLFDYHIPPNWGGFFESNIANSIPIMQ